MAGKWRWIDSVPADGPMNMAVDEALLNCYRAGIPVFRTYAWQPEALSLGRFQNARKVLELETCTNERISVVRRITGGGIIHHHDELTYSLVCGQEDIGTGMSVKESYRVLCGFLLQFYKELGLQADFSARSNPSAAHGIPAAFCFAGREEYDITVGGKKIGGNAQRRFKNVIFQHGSIPIRLSRVSSAKYLAEKPADMTNAVSLEEMGISLGRKELTGILKRSFMASLGTGLEISNLNEEENNASAVLFADKYTTDEWNLDEIPGNFPHSPGLQCQVIQSIRSTRGSVVSRINQE